MWNGLGRNNAAGEVPMRKAMVNPRRKGGIAVSLCSPGPALGSLRAGLARTSCIPSPSLIYSPPRRLWSLFIRTRRGENLSRRRGELVYQFYFWFYWPAGMRGQPRGAARPVRVDTGRERCGLRAASRDTRKERARTVQTELSSSFQEARRAAEAGKQQG